MRIFLGLWMGFVTLFTALLGIAIFCFMPDNVIVDPLLVGLSGTLTLLTSVFTGICCWMIWSRIKNKVFGMIGVSVYVVTMLFNAYHLLTGDLASLGGLIGSFLIACGFWHVKPKEITDTGKDN
jgi:hypothetical protein